MTNSKIPTLLNERELSNLLGIHRATIWRNINSGHLPKPIRISKRRNRWPLEEVQKHLGLSAAQ